MEDMADLFDHIEDLLDFPCDEDLIGLVDPCGGQAAPLLLPPLPASAAGVGADSLDGLAAKTKKLGAALSPEEDKKDACDDLDLVQLEWMSKFLDDSDAFPLDLPNGDGAANSDNSDGAHAQVKAAERCFFRTSSPVSVLEANTNGGGGGGTTSSSSSSSSFSYSSSSTSVSYFIGSNKDARAPLPPLSPQDQPLQVVVPARARSKRPRPASFSPRARVAVPYFSPPSDVVTVSNPISSTDTATSEPESFGESRVTPPPAKKGKATKKAHAAAASGLWEEIGSAPPVRKCMHCEIQKTPQWRAGPMGPKTLCNACGVRYKSGRLFPEYRPAASPTFVPAIHSNSHKKVVEMRVKSTQNTAPAGATDNCDLLQCIRRRE